MGKPRGPMSGNEVLRECDRQGCKRLRRDGSHVTIRLPNGDLEVIADHRHTMGKGIWCKIYKHLIAAGIVLSVAFALMFYCGMLA